MSWGERSCQSPCRYPSNCKYETCNVDCPGYIWDKATKPDTKSRFDITFLPLQIGKTLENNKVKKQIDEKNHPILKHFRRNKKNDRLK